MDKEYLAHSAHDGFPEQTYLNHVQNVHDDAFDMRRKRLHLRQNRKTAWH